MHPDKERRLLKIIEILKQEINELNEKVRCTKRHKHTANLSKAPTVTYQKKQKTDGRAKRENAPKSKKNATTHEENTRYVKSNCINYCKKIKFSREKSSIQTRQVKYPER